ncbi:MAG: DNA repair protein RecO [Salinarimonadaceae bacterium]|nr:MAG: DNA repair protein RecO [Salinarimonadaceae bacterium]
MEWSDDALVIGSRRHGETGLLLELLTREHGRHLGFVPGGRSRRIAPMLQPGNAVRATWRARLDEHLGTFAVEATELRAARYIANPRSLYGLAAMTALLRLLPERDPHPHIFDTAQDLADHLDEPEVAGALFVGFELTLLSVLGFGLDLSECAATGARSDLAFVSPRTGRAVSRAAGEPWRDKLLSLPAFLVHDGGLNRVPGDQLAEAFALTGYFLDRWIFEPQGLKPPQERTRFVASVTRDERP